MKQILKSIKAHRKQSAALFIEIVIVTIIGWIVIEPVAMDTSMALIPAGYDYERLVSVTFSNFDYKSEEYDSTLNNPTQEKQRLLTLIREHPEVESATYTTYQTYESGSSSSTGFRTDSIHGLEGDDTWISTYIIHYVPKTDFFSTFGIKDANGNPFAEPEVDGKSFIVSKTLAKARYANESAIGKDLYEYDDKEGHTPITGIIQDTPYRKSDGRRQVMIKPVDNDEIGWSVSGIAMRLKEGVSPRVFVDKLTSNINQYRAGNTYLTHPVLMADERDAVFAEQSRSLAKGWIILTFFLVNVILGVAGTFYIQCRTRTADSGVMRAFGATRHKVEWNIVGEALLSVVFAWAVGSILYLAYLTFAHVEFENNADMIVRMLNPMWFDSALSRNSIVGGLILLLLLFSTLLGVWLPARKIGRVNPVDALRDE